MSIIAFGLTKRKEAKLAQHWLHGTSLGHVQSLLRTVAAWTNLVPTTGLLSKQTATLILFGSSMCLMLECRDNVEDLTFLLRDELNNNKATKANKRTIPKEAQDKGRY